MPVPEFFAMSATIFPISTSASINARYFSSLCSVLFLQNLQNFFISSLPVCFFLFLVLV